LAGNLQGSLGSNPQSKQPPSSPVSNQPHRKQSHNPLEMPWVDASSLPAVVAAVQLQQFPNKRLVAVQLASCSRCRHMPALPNKGNLLGANIYICVPWHTAQRAAQGGLPQPLGPCTAWWHYPVAICSASKQVGIPCNLYTGYIGFKAGHHPRVKHRPLWQTNNTAATVRHAQPEQQRRRWQQFLMS
jgi:hypothetical protein